MNYSALGKTEKFFEGLTTAVLMPLAVLLGVSVGLILGVLFAGAIYGELLLAGMRAICRGARKSFGKAAAGSGPLKSAAPAETARPSLGSPRFWVSPPPPDWKQ